MNKTIHIVCLDAPSPPDYGGAVDMFYKIKALAETGHNIILHYFDYKANRNANELEEYCQNIFGYKRKSLLFSLPLFRPHIVQSRINKHLIKRLNADDHPVLLEGLHCTGIVPFLRNKQRIVIRMHNDEAAYYHHLGESENSLLKKAYFFQEAKRLRRYQAGFDKQIKLACLSETDVQLLRNDYHFQDVQFIPFFLPWREAKCKEGNGSYCLYHGNLAVSENEEAVLWLVNNIFVHLQIPFVIAGKNCSTRIRKSVRFHPHITVINDPPDDEMAALITDAHIHLLPSISKTGVKLKLLNALFNGRFCITNNNGVNGSGIQNGVVVCHEANEWRRAIVDLMEKDFTTTEMAKRDYLLSLYNNQQNAQKLSALWTHYL